MGVSRNIPTKLGMIMKTYKLISALAVTVSSTALFVATANPAFAQQDTSAQAAEAEEATGINAIIVTGTRRTDRTVADSTVPVDVISGEALLNSGTTETNKLLNQLVPSFNFPQPSLTDGIGNLAWCTMVQERSGYRGSRIGTVVPTP